jgi:outer membrane protein TolC
LAVLLGRTPDRVPDIPAFASLATPIDVPVSVASQLLAQRPDIQAAAAALQATAMEVGVAKAAMLPSLTLTAAVGRGGLTQPSWLSGPGVLWGMFASLSAPVFHGGALQASKRAAIQNYEGARDTYRQTVYDAFRDVADRLVRLDDDAKRLSGTERAADIGARQWRHQQARNALGAIPDAAVRAAERQYLNSRHDALDARASRMTDTAGLFAAMGVSVTGTKSTRTAATTAANAANATTGVKTTD